MKERTPPATRRPCVLPGVHERLAVGRSVECFPYKHIAKERHQQSFAFGQGLAQPMEQNRCHRNVRKPFGQLGDTPLEGRQLFRRPATALGKEDQHLTGFQRLVAGTQQILIRCVTPALDGQNAHDVQGEPGLAGRGQEIIRRGHRPDPVEQARRQQGDQYHGVQMAVVVGNNDGRPLGRQAFAVPHVEPQDDHDHQSHDDPVEEIAQNANDEPHGLRQ